MKSRRATLFAASVAAIAATLVYLVSTQVFPYHSFNHDEAVYLQQAAMLLDGQLRMYPPVPEAFRTWFFVTDGGAMYPRYSPVVAALFALGELVWSYRAALAFVAAVNVVLVYLLAREAFDRAVGVVAAAFLAASPLFLIQSSLFLPYSPTTTLNLLFAFAYIRSLRRGSWKYGLLAGAAAGLAFFARPYTALLFAAPFLLHAGITMVRREEWVVRRNLVLTATVGSLFVAVTLAYNAAMTGSPHLFPFEVFAPGDGLGFGERSLLGYTRNYTPLLALEANARVVWSLLSAWMAGGFVGAVLAGVGLIVGLYVEGGDGEEVLSDRVLRALFAGVFVSVVLGNLYFWGNLNILGGLISADDGFISLFGPYYHYDALLPLSVFAASGAVYLYRRLREVDVRVGVAAALVLAVAVTGVSGMMFAETADRNQEITEVYREAYEPFENRDLENALVFLPTPAGDWLNHPYQYLRNDPGYDGDVVYALDGGRRNFRVVDAFPDRSIYRYSYRGEWEPFGGEKVTPKFERLDVVEGSEVRVSTSVAVPADVRSASVRFSSVGGAVYREVNVSDPTVLEWRVAPGNASLQVDGERVSVPLNRSDRVTLELYFVRDGLGSELYRQELLVRSSEGDVEVFAPPHTEYCGSSTGCTGEETLVEDRGITTSVSGVPVDRP